MDGLGGIGPGGEGRHALGTPTPMDRAPGVPGLDPPCKGLRARGVHTADARRL